MTKKRKKECKHDLEEKELRIILFRCKKCGFSKKISGEKGWHYKKNIQYSGPFVGEEADYMILWERYPTPEETLALVKHLDGIFAKCSCKYSVATDPEQGEDIFAQIEASEAEDIALTFVRLIGPNIFQAIELLIPSPLIMH